MKQNKFGAKKKQFFIVSKFHGVPLWSIMVCKIPGGVILEVKTVRLVFCPVRFKQHTH